MEDKHIHKKNCIIIIGMNEIGGFVKCLKNLCVIEIWQFLDPVMVKFLKKKDVYLRVEKA